MLMDLYVADWSKNNQYILKKSEGIDLQAAH